MYGIPFSFGISFPKGFLRIDFKYWVFIYVFSNHEIDLLIGFIYGMFWLYLLDYDELWLYYTTHWWIGIVCRRWPFPLTLGCDLYFNCVFLLQLNYLYFELLYFEYIMKSDVLYESGWLYDHVVIFGRGRGKVLWSLKTNSSVMIYTLWDSIDVCVLWLDWIGWYYVGIEMSFLWSFELLSRISML